ncbi:hypothetical protein IFM89_002282 [Coptis chinensis]|uniref:Plant bHLH transcription factor ACT-like domain-containing protein n=1 Tax=Coptis chinensis TaxID=261450 RepID=A0A835ILS2_9MAGN|nr:hypothetical protein IFM89_002282 [Coptis chinensis]
MRLLGREMGEEGGKRNKSSEDEDEDDLSMDGDDSNANGIITGGGDQKGKKKGPPAMNLMAERRGRKKLNDRLYMLWSVVPKISKVEVKMREGRAVNIHMFYSQRPDLLISTMKALYDLGLDIQQSVIRCFNGFALVVFHAEVRFLPSSFLDSTKHAKYETA